MRFPRQNFGRVGLTEITYWEVQSVESKFLPQLTLEHPTRIRTGIFCSLALRLGPNMPPRVFGMIVSCFPDNATEIVNVHSIELLFPRVNQPPNLVTIDGSEIAYHLPKIIETYLFRIPVFGGVEDFSDFEPYIEEGRIKGYEFEARTEPEELEYLRIDKNLLFKYPKILIVTSRWLSMLRPEIYSSVIASLLFWLKQGQIIINYHPLGETIALNSVLQLHPSNNSPTFYDAFSVEEIFSGIDDGFEKVLNLFLPNREHIKDSQETVLSELGGAKLINDSLKVFLCHSSSDKLTVKKLFSQLKAENGIDPWLDEEKLLPGENWDFEIRKAVKESHVVIVMLSNGSINKEGYIQKEIRFALDIANEKPEGTIFIVPVKIEKCDVPDSLSHWQWLNYYEEGAYEKLLRSLKKRAQNLGINFE